MALTPQNQEPVSADDTSVLIAPANTRVMVVDDEPSIRDLLQRAFTLAGYQAVTAENADRALQLLETQPVDVMVTDIKMPGTIDGIQLIKIARNKFHIDSIVMTGYLGEYDYESIVRNGASDFVLKPVATNELVVRLRRVVRERRLREDRNTKNLELQTTLAVLQEAYHDTIFRLVRASEYKDESTGSHILRMGQMCVMIAEDLGLARAEIENLYYAAPMHDVGKIGIPDSVLLKPGKLTEQEFETMKQHTTIGAAILENPSSDILRLAREIVLTHHEQWDGRGYPRGLAGHDIPLGGRIVKVVDVFDALTSTRPYKDPYPVDVAFKIIEKERGIQFDPDIVDTFLGIRDKIVEIKSAPEVSATAPGAAFLWSERDKDYLPGILGPASRSR